MALEMGEKLESMEAWGSSGDANNMWDKIASCIRKVVREVLGFFRDYFCGHQRDWW